MPTRLPWPLSEYSPTIFEQMPVPQLLIDLSSGAIAAANPAAVDFYGYAPGVFSALHVTDLLPQPAMGQTSSLQEALIDPLHVFHHRHRLADGSLRDIAMKSVILHDGDVSYALLTVQAESPAAGAEAQAGTHHSEYRHVAILEALRSNVEAISRTLDSEKILDLILENLSRVIDFDAANILQVDGDAGRVVRHLGYRERGLGEWLESFVFSMSELDNFVRLLNLKKPVCISDTYADENWIYYPESGWVASHLGVPIMIDGEVIGLLLLDSETPGAFTDADGEYLQVFANQAAVAIRNARLYESERKQLEISRVLQEVGAVLTSDESLPGLLDRVFDLLARIVPYDSVSIQLIDDRGQMEMIFSRGYEDIEVSHSIASETFSRTVHERWKDRDVLVIPDTANDDRWIDYDEAENIRSWVGAAMRVKGRLVGVLNIDSKTIGTYDEQALPTVAAFANQAAIAIENARLHKEEQVLLHVEATLRKSASVLNATLELDEVLHLILEQLDQVLAFDSASVQRLQEGQLQIVAAHGFADNSRLEGLRYPNSTRYPNDIVFNTMAPLTIADVQERYPHFVNEADRYQSGEIRSWLGVPLVVDDKPIGIITIDRHEVKPYTEAEINLVSAFADQAALAISKADLYAQSQAHVRRLGLLNYITRAGTSTLDTGELARKLVNAVSDVLESDACFLTLWDPVLHLVIPTAASGDWHDNYAARGPVRADEGLTAAVLKTGKPLHIDDVLNTPYLSQEAAARFAVRSVIVLPLKADGYDIGALFIGFLEQRELSTEHHGWTNQIAELVALAIAKAQAYTVLEKRVQARTAELQMLNEKLQNMSRLKDEFVANVSHELRTPIASLKLYHHLLTARPAKQAQYLNHLNRETERLELIIENLLYLSRMDQGEIDVNMAPVNVRSLVDNYIADRRLLASSRGVALKFESDDKLPKVQGDERLLNRAVGVLVTNALNYTPPGGKVLVQVQSIKQKGAGWVVVAVSDTGPGIPPEELSQIFDRFFRGKVARDSGVPGTGLGLSIAQEIMGFHQGRIDVTRSVESEQGACFRLWLPVDKDK